MPEDKAYQLLQEGEYGVMSMITPEGMPYGIPINYVWDGNDSLYIHCAPEGKKLRCLQSSPQVSFAIVAIRMSFPGNSRPITKVLFSLAMPK